MASWKESLMAKSKYYTASYMTRLRKITTIYTESVLSPSGYACSSAALPLSQFAQC
jgi:hypothetical protein